MNKIKKLQPKNIGQLFLGIISIAILIITFSCEEDPSSLGADLLPDSDKIEYRYDTTLIFNSYVTTNEAIITSNLSHYSLGIIDDPYFGSFKGEFAGQFLPYLNDTNIMTHNIDSVMLFLAIDSIYGQVQESLSFNIYELNSEINEDSSNYSNYDISILYTEVDKINTSCNIQGDSLIAFTLTDAFAEKLKSDTAFYSSDSAFKSVFKGISIIPTISDVPGGILHTNFTSVNSKIILYYHTDTVDSLSLNYSFSNGHRFSKYTYDYSTAIINDYLTNPENENDNLIFLQGINGISSKISFSNIDPWFEGDSSYSILKAELTIPVFNDDNIELFHPPQNLFLYYYEPDSTMLFAEMFDGSYNDSENQYSFNISKHFMNFVNRSIEDSCLNISMVNPLNYYYYYPYPHRVILKSGENIKLKVTYIKHE